MSNKGRDWAADRIRAEICNCAEMMSACIKERPCDYRDKGNESYWFWQSRQKAFEEALMLVVDERSTAWATRHHSPTA